jgi:hypothetical protein
MKRAEMAVAALRVGVLAAGAAATAIVVAMSFGPVYYQRKVLNYESPAAIVIIVATATALEAVAVYVALAQLRLGPI